MAKKSIEMTVVKVGPELAQEWLDTMRHNRRLSTANVERLTQLMIGGYWVFDGSPIRFNTKGELVDGQHRLWALIEANAEGRPRFEAEFTVVHNVPDEAFATMDTGKQRSFSDIISIEFPDQPAVVLTASITQAVYRWEQGSRGSSLRSGSRAGGTIPNGLLLKFFRENREEITELVRLSNRVSNGLRGFTATNVALAAWAFRRTEDWEDDYDEFFGRLQDGQGLVEGDPRYTLRRTGENTVRASDALRARITLDLGMAYMIKAWNAYRDGAELHQLKWRKGGAKPEPFPEPR